MKNASCLIALFVLSISACRADGRQRFTLDRQYTLEERETIRRNLEFSSGRGTRTLEVDAVLGAIHVTGYDGSDVEMTALKTIRAHSAEQVRLAKETVKLDISDKTDTISIYVDQPGHQPSSRSRGNFDWRDPGYEVVFDFELRVPRTTEVHLENITEDIRVEGISGDFDVSAINGQIEMTKIAGSGRVHTINGPVYVRTAVVGKGY